MSIPIYQGVRTALMDRMVVGYHRMGREDELVFRLQKLGVQPFNEDGRPEDRLLTQAEAATWANIVLTWTGAFHPGRTNCYFCGSESGGSGRLCDCFREVVIQDWYDLRDRKLIAGLTPNVIVTTSQCEDCGIPVPITARVVQKFYAKNNKGTYYGRRHCHEHWLMRKKEKDARQREARQQHKKKGPAPVLSTTLDLSQIELPQQQPVGEA